MLHVVPMCDFLASVICSVKMTHGGRGFCRKRMMHIFNRAKRGAASGTLLTCAALTRLGAISFSDPDAAV